MSQFGGAPRDQDYGFFTTPARTAVSTSQFGSTAVETRPAHAAGSTDERPAPAFGLPAPAHRAEPERSRNRWGLPVALLLVIALLGGAALAYQNGLIPGLNQSAAGAPAVVTPLAPYVVAAPDQLLGWERSSGPEAQQIDAMLRDSGAFPADAVTTFLYVTGRGKPALYGAVVVQHLSRAEQRDNLANTTRGMRQASPDTLGAFTERPAGDLGGFFRCATLRIQTASTTCVFTTSETSGVLMVLGQTGKPAVDAARTAREAIITRR